MFDTEVSEFLQLMNQGFPLVHEMTGAQARAAVAARRPPVDNIDDVHSTEDRAISTEHGRLPVRIYYPHGSGSTPLPVVVFFHGGGFVFCDIESHDGFCRRMAKNATAVVVSVDYRLAPEHRAPAAAWDAYAALVWVAEHAVQLGADPDQIVTAGDSAGGNLAAVVCIMACEFGGPRVAAQVLAYPVIEPSFDTPSYQTYASGYFNTTAAMQWYWRQYLGTEYLGTDAIPEPVHFIAPLRAPHHHGLPPAIVITAGMDPLSSEGQQYAGTLKHAGVPVIHRHYPGLFHGFLTIGPLRAAVAARELLWADLAAVLSDSTRKVSS